MQLTSTCWICDDRRPEASPQRKPTGTLFHRKRDSLNSLAEFTTITLRIPLNLTKRRANPKTHELVLFIANHLTH